MKKAEGYVIRKLEEEYVLIPCGERAEEMNETISLSETAGFIYINADKADSTEELAGLVAEEIRCAKVRSIGRCKGSGKNITAERNSAVKRICYLDPRKKAVMRKQTGRSGSIKSHRAERKRYSGFFTEISFPLRTKAIRRPLIWSARSGPSISD